MTATADPRPLLVVVAGRPGAGKSTLAHALARAVRCPAICRDEVMEGLVHTAGPAADAWHVYEAFFDVVQRLLTHRVTLVAEAAFQHKLWAPKLLPLGDLARVRLVLCHVTAEVAHARRLRRASDDPDRERFHPDPVVQAARDGRPLPPADYDPPRLDVPTLTVDTSAGYEPAFASVVAFALA